MNVYVLKEWVDHGCTEVVGVVADEAMAKQWKEAQDLKYPKRLDEDVFHYAMWPVQGI